MFEIRASDVFTGAIARAVLTSEGSFVGWHAFDAFAAAGPLARELVGGQTALDVYAPLRELQARDGWVLLMGVGLNRMTLLHEAERVAGRELFRRWAMVPGGTVETFAVGGCSEGFPRLEPVLRHLARQTTVGVSRWCAFPAGDAVAAVAAAIWADPEITRCATPGCLDCADAIAGGPIL